MWVMHLEFTNPNWNNVYISIKENTLTYTEATFIIKNKNFISVDYLVDDYHIYKKNGDRWKQLPELSTNYPDNFNARISNPRILYTYERNINWENKYGKLDSGIYRIDFQFNSFNKPVSSSITISVEFILK